MKKIIAMMFVIVAALLINTAVFAQTGLNTVHNYNELPINYVTIGDMNMEDAVFSSTNASIRKMKWRDSENGNKDAIVYYGPLTWGTANRTTAADAKLGTTSVPGSFSLRYNNAAVLPDGTKADVLLTFTDWKIMSGERPSGVTSGQSVYMGLVISQFGTEYFTGNARMNPTNTTGLAATFAQRVTTNVKILKNGTDETIDAAKYPAMLTKWLDLDTVDKTVAAGKSDAEQYAGKYTEGIGMISGFKSPYYTTPNAIVASQTVDGAQKIRGTKPDDNTLDSGFIAAVEPQGYSYYWYGSIAMSSYESGIIMGSYFQPSPTVNVFAAAGTGGSVEKPGETVYSLNGTTTYEYAPDRGYKVKSLKINGAEVPFSEHGGTYKFSKLIERNKEGYDHTISVQFSPPTVTYEWAGEHPDQPVPRGGEIVPGAYETDTSFTAGDTVRETNVSCGGKTYPRGTWTFEGWDKNGTLEVYEDTKILGTWSFTPEWNIGTSVVNGTVTDSENNIPDGQNRSVVFTPHEGYQLRSINVDRQDMDIREYPASYSFTGIHADHTVDIVYEKIPVLEIEKNVDKDTCNAGDTLRYTVTIRQTAEGAEARNVILEDILPDGIRLIEDSLEGEVTVKEISGSGYTLLVDSLTGELTYTYSAVTDTGADAVDLINTVSAKAENIPGIVSDEAKASSFTPKPEITKIVSNENPVPGETVTYVISVKEPQEGVELRNAVVTDHIPAGIEITGDMEIAGDDAQLQAEEGTVTVQIPALKSECVLTFHAIVTAEEGAVDNTAALNGDNITEMTASAKLTVQQLKPMLSRFISTQPEDPDPKPVAEEPAPAEITEEAEPQEKAPEVENPNDPDMPEKAETAEEPVHEPAPESKAHAVESPQTGQEMPWLFAAAIVALLMSVCCVIRII